MLNSVILSAAIAGISSAATGGMVVFVQSDSGGTPCAVDIDPDASVQDITMDIARRVGLTEESISVTKDGHFLDKGQQVADTGITGEALLIYSTRFKVTVNSISWGQDEIERH